MQLNTSTCYAMQVILLLARNREIVSSTELSELLHISQRYILQLMGKLRDGCLISTHHGINGGCDLSKDASTISIYDVIELMEGDMSIPNCFTHKDECGSLCRSTYLLDSLNYMKDYLDSYLKSITFDKLVDMEISGNLSEILGIVREHTDIMKQKSR